MNGKDPQPAMLLYYNHCFILAVNSRFIFEPFKKVHIFAFTPTIESE